MGWSSILNANKWVTEPWEMYADQQAAFRGALNQKVGNNGQYLLLDDVDSSVQGKNAEAIRSLVLILGFLTLCILLKAKAKKKTKKNRCTALLAKFNMWSSHDTPHKKPFFIQISTHQCFLSFCHLLSCIKTKSSLAPTGGNFFFQCLVFSCMGKLLFPHF